MFSTEFRYKLNNLRRILKKATVQLIRILFILASVATIVLMAYEYGYAISEAGKRYVTEGFNIIIRIFFLLPDLFGIQKDRCDTAEKENPDDDIESLCNVSFPCLTDRITVFVGHQYDRCH